MVDSTDQFKINSLIPELRFPEFDSIWFSKKLEEIALRGSGHTPNKKKPEYYDGEIKWVSLADSSQLDNGYIYETKTKVSQDGINNSSAVIHPKESVLLSRDAGVGKSAVMSEDMAVSQHFIVWNGKPNQLDNWFFYYKLQILKPIFERMAVGNTIKTIGLPYFKKLKIIVPDFKEQQKIANFLTAIDQRITLLKQKKKALEQYKKGLMQKIFSQEIRFLDDGNDYPDWESKKVSDLFEVTRGQVLAMRNTEPHATDFCKYPVYSSQTKDKGLAGYYKEYLFENAITWTTDGANAGETNFREGRFYCTNVCGVLINNVGYANNFMAALINSISRRYVSYVGNPKLMNNVMSSIKLTVPCVEEQQKIAQCLSAIDQSINQLTSQIDQNTQFKKGLLQRMFV